MFHKRHPPVGSRPGTLVVAHEAPAPRVSVHHSVPDGVQAATVDRAAELRPWLERDGVLWVDVQGLGDHALLQDLAALFDIHPLALEDVVNTPQRPKTETYDRHQLYVSRMVTMDTANGAIDIEQVSVFIGKSYVLTFQERYGDVLDPIRVRLREGKGPIRHAGADYLGYAIIDTIIDHYYPAIELVSDTLERLELRVMEHPTQRTLGDINRMKHTLLDLRRAIWPQRDAINALVRGDSPFVSEAVRVYFRDSYDHAVQITDVIETYRDLAAGLFNTYLAVVSNRMNEVMKVLTVMASTFIPLTFLAGIYGMNFERMPELHTRWGYPLLLALMAVIGVGMVILFRRKGWLGEVGDGDRDD